MQFSLQTKRLLLRDIREEDAQAMFEMDSDTEVHRYLGNQPVASVKEVEEVIRYIQQQYKEHGIGRWAVVEKDTGEFVGWCGLKLIKEEVNGHSHFYDLGYRFLKKYWGRGYATETALASIEYGFSTMHLEEICAMADINNSVSNHVLQKIGMTRTGTFLFDGIEHYFYKTLREGWQRVSDR